MNFHEKGSHNIFQLIFTTCIPGDYAYIIESGRVGTYHAGYQCKRSLISILKESEVFEEMGLIDKYPRSATTIASEDTRCIVIETSRFNYLKSFSPYFLTSLIKSLTKTCGGSLSS
ncbi:MAG: cyclic nucleotide-binding domain-containing protein [Nitrospinia bacterium]